MGNGAPSEISRTILKYLLMYKDDLPFENIKIFCKKKDVPKVKEELKNIDIMTYSDLTKITQNSLVHIPVLPSILPNSKFLLYVYCSRIRRTKLILQYHGDVRNELKSSYKDIRSLVHILSYILLPNLLKSVDMVITHSYYMKEIIKNYGVLKSVVIPNALDDYWFQQNDKTTYIINSIDKNSFNIFYHGRLSWEKGIDILLEAIGYYIRDNPKTMIYIAGEGPQKKYLEELCLRFNINKNVIFTGNLGKEEIISFLKNVDVAIYPSRFDNFPLAVLEALACSNCPVYFSKNIGIYDFVIQEQANLKTFDPSVEKLTEILRSAYLDTDKKNTVDQQIKFAKNYTWNRVVLKYIELYREVIANRS